MIWLIHCLAIWGCDIATGLSPNLCLEYGDSSICENDENQIGFVRKCESGKTIASTCDNNFSCDANNIDCGECRNFDYFCKDNEDKTGVVSTCADGKWSTAACSNVSCNTNNECGSCLNGQTKCISDGISR